MIVKVTQEHIDKARQSIKANIYLCRSLHCPVTFGIKDSFKVKFAQVTYNTITVGRFPEDNIVFTTIIPSEVSNKICLFDTDNILEPFEFELSLEGVKL